MALGRLYYFMKQVRMNILDLVEMFPDLMEEYIGVEDLVNLCT